jgi:hypothetical protein
LIGQKSLKKALSETIVSGIDNITIINGDFKPYDQSYVDRLMKTQQIF